MAGIALAGQVGQQVNAAGSQNIIRTIKTGEVAVSEVHGRFYEQTYNGNVFSIGCQLTALSAATILLTSSSQPIVGVWNPPTSLNNLVILQAALQDEINTVTTPTAVGSFVWASSQSNASLTAGLAPFNRKTMQTNGSQAKAFALSTASLLTGLTNNLTIFETADFSTVTTQSTTLTSTATQFFPSVVGIQNFDGSLIVPPGGVLALLNTASTTAHSVSARLMWEEVPQP
jgi:hypothetical protein